MFLKVGLDVFRFDAAYSYAFQPSVLLRVS